MSVLANRLIQIPEGKDRYEAAMRHLLDDVWDGDARLAQIDAWSDLAHDDLSSDERQAGRDLRDFVAEKADDVEAQLGDRVKPAALRTAPCLVDVGQVQIAFATTYGSYPNGDLYGGGTTTTSWVVNDTTYTSVKDGTTVGPADDQTVFLTISEVGTNTWLAAYVTFDTALLLPGASIDLDDGEAQAALLYNSPDNGNQWATAAYLGDGSLTFGVAGTADGAALTGTLTAAVMGGG